MNREELSEAIHDLASTPHMSKYVIEQACGLLDLERLKQLFDYAADHYELTTAQLHRAEPRLNPWARGGRP